MSLLKALRKMAKGKSYEENIFLVHDHLGTIGDEDHERYNLWYPKNRGTIKWFFNDLAMDDLTFSHYKQ